MQAGRGAFLIAAVAAAVTFIQAYEYIFPLGQGWVYDYGAALETIPVHLALMNQHVLGGPLAPFVAGGVDRLSFFGNADSPLLLSTWLFALFSPPVANGVHMLLQCFVGSVFAGLLCLDRLKLGIAVSAVAAIVYASLSYPVFGFLFNAALIPFFAWFTMVPRTRSWGSLLLAGLGASFLTSLSQGFPFTALFLVLWMPIVARASISATAKTLAAITVGYCLGKLPALLAILNAVAGSQRSGEIRYDSLIDTPILYTESDFLYSDRHMWTYTQVVPAFFAALSLVYLMAGLVGQWRRRGNPAATVGTDPPVGVVLRLAVVYAILASGVLVPIRNLLIPVIPWLGSINMVRTVTTSGALLNTLVVAYGLVIVQRGAGRRAFAAGVGSISAAAGASWALRHSWTVSAEYALLLLVLATGAVWAAVLHRLHDPSRPCTPGRVSVEVAALLPVALLAIVYACLAPKTLLEPLRNSPQSGFARYHIPAIPEIERDDQTLHRYASVLPLQPANALPGGVETLDGWANLYSSRFRQFWLTMLDPLFESLPGERRTFGADGTRPQDHYIFLGTGQFLPTDPVGGMDVDSRFNMSLLSLMNVRYLLSYYPLSSKHLVEMHVPAQPFDKMTWHHYNGRVTELHEAPIIWPNVAKGLMSVMESPPALADRVYAYRNVCALPRAFSVERVETHGSDSDVLKSLTEASPVDLLRTAHALNTEAPPRAEQLARATLRLLRYEGGTIDLHAVSSGEAVIVIANTWIPGWQASVDGRDAPLFRVNHTQIAIHLPEPGTFRVTLAYEPPFHQLLDVLAAPARLVADAHRPEPSYRQLDFGDLPPACASPNAH